MVNDADNGFLFDFVLKLNECINETSVRLVYKYYEGWMKSFKNIFILFEKLKFLSQNK